ncbi:hypothetical protein Golax_022933, partial [Gossypium laxum]|nr:hypothetical protein [Gossypium laxum]
PDKPNAELDQGKKSIKLVDSRIRTSVEGFRIGCGLAYVADISKERPVISSCELPLPDMPRLNFVIYGYPELPDKWSSELPFNGSLELPKYGSYELPSDTVVWQAEPSRVYTVRSGCRILQEIDGADTNDVANRYTLVYKKMWKLNLPEKVKITVWHIFNNLITNMYNLYNRRLAGSATCPKCLRGVENLEHGFRDCPFVVNVWNLLDIKWEDERGDLSFQAWI